MKIVAVSLAVLIGAYCLIMAGKQLATIIRERTKYQRIIDWYLAIIGQVIMILGVIGITTVGIVTINQFIS